MSSPEQYVLFVWKPTGYELREQNGEPPSVGSGGGGGEGGRPEV